MIEAVVIIMLTFFLLYILYSLFLWLFTLLINIALIVAACYVVRSNVYKYRSIYIICAFLGIFAALYGGGIPILWRITTALVVTVIAAYIGRLIAEKFD